MNYDEIRKLLGGYATGTLTEEERQRLMGAAMEDQRIFDALADEEALRELLADSSFRQELLLELREVKPGLQEKIVAWWRRPLPLALAGGLATVALAALVLVPIWRQESPVDVAVRQETPRESLMESEEAVPEMGVRSVAQAGNEGSAAPVGRLKKEKSAKQVMVGGAGGGGGGSASPPASPEPELYIPPERRDRDAPVEPKKQTMLRQVGSSADLRERRQIAESAESDEEKPQATMAFRATGQAAVMEDAARPALEAARAQVRVERLTADAVWVTVAPDGSVSLRDTVRVEIVAPADGHAYVLTNDNTGQWKLAAEGRVPGGRPAYLPAEGGLPSPTQAVDRTVAVVFSTEELAAGTAQRAASLAGGEVVKTVVRYE